MSRVPRVPQPRPVSYLRRVVCCTTSNRARCATVHKPWPPSAGAVPKLVCCSAGQELRGSGAFDPRTAPSAGGEHAAPSGRMWGLGRCICDRVAQRSGAGSARAGRLRRLVRSSRLRLPIVAPIVDPAIAAASPSGPSGRCYPVGARAQRNTAFSGCSQHLVVPVVAQRGARARAAAV
jgi:hypothetical protein